jgi:hypothetical protein
MLLLLLLLLLDASNIQIAIGGKITFGDAALRYRSTWDWRWSTMVQWWLLMLLQRRDKWRSEC